MRRRVRARLYRRSADAAFARVGILSPRAVSAYAPCANGEEVDAEALRLRSVHLCAMRRYAEDLRSSAFTLNFNFAANCIYSADASCIDTVIGDGKALMRGRSVADEGGILENAAKAACNLVRRSSWALLLFSRIFNIKRRPEHKYTA